MSHRSKISPTLTPVAAALAALDSGRLADELEIAVDQVWHRRGDDAFTFDRRVVAEHEACHVLVGHHERIPVQKAEVFRDAEPAPSAIGVGDFRHGVVYSKIGHRVSADSAPQTDLRWIKYILAGHIGTKLSARHRAGLGLDELILGRALTRVVAAKIDADPNVMFTDTCAIVRRIIRANWSIVTALADKLERDGSAIDNRWRREILATIRRIG